MDKNKNETPVVFDNSHVEVLSERGGPRGLADSAREKISIENMERIFRVAKQNGYPVFISPHARRNQIRSVRQSIGISPRCAEETITTRENGTTQFQPEQPRPNVAARYRVLLRISQ